MYQKLTTKLFKLFTGELAATIVFVTVWIMYLNTYEWTKPYLTSLATLFAFFLLEFLLLQGSYYWFLKWRQAKRRNFSFLPKNKLKFFTAFKKLNILLLGVGFGILLYQLFYFSNVFYWLLFLYLFALVEHINYYHVRLSYQTREVIEELKRHRRFRSSKLAEELKNK